MRLDGEQRSEAENGMALDIATEPPGADSPVGPHLVIVEPDDDIAAICGKMDMSPSDQVILAVRRRNRSLRSEVGLPRVKKHALNTGRTIALVTSDRELRARARQLEMPVFGSIKRVRFGALNPWVFSVGALSIVIPRPDLSGLFRLALFGGAGALLLLLAYVFLPSATVTIQPETQTVGRILNVVANSKVTQTSVADFTVPARPARLAVPVEVVVPVTGPDATVGEKQATGEVQLINRTDSVQFVPGGTKVSTDDGKQFYTLVSAQLPGEPEARVSVPAQASAGGESFNVPANAIKRVDGLGDQIAVQNERAFSGGTNRTVRTVTENDLNMARTLARRKARDAGLQQVGDQSNGQSFPIVDSTDLALTDEKFNAKVGDAADYLVLNATAVLNVLVVDQSDLRPLAQTQLQPREEGLALLSNGFGARPLQVRSYNPIDQRADVDVLVTAAAARPLNVEAIRQRLRGMTRAEAEQYLRSQLPLRSVKIETHPSWLGLPRLAQRIQLQVIP
jgi:hypothetical protein